LMKSTKLDDKVNHFAASRFLATKFELQRSQHGTTAGRYATRRWRQPASGSSRDETG
jgi:hypothetical protein